MRLGVDSEVRRHLEIDPWHGANMTSRLLALLLLAALASGCHSTVTPLDARRTERADDPLLSTAEQRVRARSFYAYPDDIGTLPGTSQHREFYYR